MSNIKDNGTFKGVPFILALCFLLRGLLLSDRRHIGFEDMYRMKFDIKRENIVFLILIIVFSVLAGLVIYTLNKRFGSVATYLSILLVAEPLVFAKQDDMMVLFISCVALLFVLNALRTKPVIPKEITLILFILISTVLFENAIFLFVFPALIIYFLGDVENLLRSVKKIIMFILSVVSVGTGIFLNNYLVSNYVAFDNFIKKYSFFEYVYFKHLEYENVFLFVFAIPMFAFGVYFLIEYIKKSDESDNNASSYAAVVAVTVSYVVAIVGFILRGSEGFYTINFIMPSAIFALLANKKSVAGKALEQVNSFVSKHLMVFIVVVVFLCFCITTMFYKDTDNLADFILTI